MSVKDNPSYFKAWYEQNKERVSKKRRALYANDSARREQAVTYQRDYRKNKERASKKGTPHFRKVGAQLLQVVRITQAALTAGCSIEFIRKYEASGVIPPSAADSPQRYYTLRQIRLIRDFFQIMKELKYVKSADLKEAALASQKQIMSSKWIGD